MTRRRPPGKRLSAAGEPMNEAELIKKIKACLAKGNKAAQKDAGILLQKFWASYAGRANRAHFWDNWEALLKTELGISRARREAGGIALGRALPSETDLHRRADEYDRCAEVRLAQEESARARTARGARARYMITFEPARGVDGVRALRWVLKMAGRRFGLVAVDAYEDVSAPQEISNRAADEFQELRDEIVEERAARFLPHPDRGDHHGR